MAEIPFMPQVEDFIDWLLDDSDWEVVDLDTYAYLARDYVTRHPNKDEILTAYTAMRAERAGR